MKIAIITSSRIVVCSTVYTEQNSQKKIELVKGIWLYYFSNIHEELNVSLEQEIRYLLNIFDWNLDFTKSA